MGLLVEAEEGLTWQRWRRLLEAAERLGFDSVWIADHLQSAFEPTRYGVDAWMALAVAAAETERLGLGTLVTPITFRQPGLLARMAESLDVLSGGRLVLGLGLGWNAAEHRAFGIPFPPFAERARRLQDGLEVIRRIAPGVRLLIGGSGRSSLDMAARFADEWNTTTASVDEFFTRNAELDRLCHERGRDPRSVHRSVACGVLIGCDAPDLARRAERMRAIVPALANAEAARTMGWLAGEPSDIVAGLRELSEAGADRAMLGIYDHDDVAALELIAATVVPALAD